MPAPIVTVAAAIARFLAEGGLRSIAKLATEAQTFPALVGRIMKRYPGTTLDMASRIASTHRKAREAGRLLASGPRERRLHLQDVPRIEGLFGPRPGGRRYEYQVLVQQQDRRTGRVHWQTKILQEPRSLTFEQVLDKVSQEVAGTEGVPTVPGGRGGETVGPGILTIQVQFVIRRF